MAIPVLSSLTPSRGPSSGGDIVRLTGTDIAPRVAVLFGGAAGEVLSVHEQAGTWLVDIRTPTHAEGSVEIVLRNLDTQGEPVPGEEAMLTAAYRFLRPRIVDEADLTRLVRTLLRALKRQVIENASITVSVDYDDTTADGLDIIAISELPSLVLSGPTLSENRFFSENQLREEIVIGPYGVEVRRRRPSFTVDLAFTLTIASDRTTELFNMMEAVARFLNRNRWLEMPRDPSDPSAGAVRWEMDPQGEFRPRLDGPDDVRVVTCGLIVRGFDIDEGLPFDLGRNVANAELATEPLEPGEPGGSV